MNKEKICICGDRKSRHKFDKDDCTFNDWDKRSKDNFKRYKCPCKKFQIYEEGKDAKMQGMQIKQG